jgi:hypothetical protein
MFVDPHTKFPLTVKFTAVAFPVNAGAAKGAYDVNELVDAFEFNVCKISTFETNNESGMSIVDVAVLQSDTKLLRGVH